MARDHVHDGKFEIIGQAYVDLEVACPEKLFEQPNELSAFNITGIEGLDNRHYGNRRANYRRSLTYER